MLKVLSTLFHIKKRSSSIFTFLQCDRQKLGLQIALVCLSLITSTESFHMFTCHFNVFLCGFLYILCHWIVVLGQILFTHHGLNILFVMSTVNNFSSLSFVS